MFGQVMASLRSRIEKSATLARILAAPFGWYLRLCRATTRWETAGLDALQADMADGPVLCVLWHGRLMMIAPHWPRRAGTLSCLHDTAPVGRVAGALQSHFGLDPFEMSARQSNIATSRAVMKRARAGISIGITADGPLGPGYAVKDAPLDWARMMQRPVYAYAFATKRHIILKTWDKMMLPLPFTRGACVFGCIDVDLPRKPTPDDIALARILMEAGLNAITAEADHMAGVTRTSDG